MANSATLTVKILGDSKNAVNEIGKVDGALGKLSRGAGIAGAALATVGIAAGVALYEIGSQFNDIENTIIKGTGATGEALDDLVLQAKDVLASVPESGGVVSQALADVNTFFGQTGDTLEESTRLFLDFARVTGTDVNTAISGLDAAFTQFGESPENLNEALGDFTRISQATGAPVDQLISQMETFGPIFANAGFSIEETAAVFGQLEQAGVDVTRIGPALNKFFRDTADAGEDPQEALQGVVTAIGDAETATEALNIASDAFGAEGAQRLTNAIRSGNFDLEEYNGLLGEGAGLVGEQAEATKTFGDRLNELKNKVFVALAPAAEAVFGAVEEAIIALEPYIEEFGVWFAEELPGWIETVQELFEEWGPVVLDAVQAFADFVIENWPLVQEIFETFYEVVTAVWGEFGDEIIAVVDNFADTIVPVIEGALQVIEGFVNVFKGVVEGDWGLLWDGLVGIFEGAWGIAEAAITGAFELLEITLGGILDAIEAAITGVWDRVVEEVTGLGSRIADAAVGIFDGVKDAFKGAINFIIDGWNNLSFAIPGFNFGPISFDGFTLSLPDIPRLATGGVVGAPMLAMVGDNPQAYRDPEIIAPQSTIRQVIDEALDARFDGAGTARQLTINATGYNRPADLLADSLEAARYDNALHGRFAAVGDREAA